jgi:hypothetical protein
VQGAANQMNLAGTDLDEEEHVQCFQAQGFDREEITGQQVVLVLAQKGTPGAALPGTQSSSRNSVPFEHSSDGRAPNTVAELEQLSFDFAVAVSGVLFGSAHDQRFTFDHNMRSSHHLPLGKGSCMPHYVAMPA